jgi:hypothetical protein
MKKGLQGRWAPRQDNSTSPSAGSPTRHVQSRAELHARLECCLLHMFIGRPFILAHRQTSASTHCSHTHTVENRSLPVPVTTHGQWDFLIHDAISAAEEVIDICHDMRTGGIGLAKSSYAEYNSCRASLLVLIAHSVWCRINEHSVILRNGLDAIREMASVSESAQSEVSLLETLQEALHCVHASNRTCDESTITVEHNSDQSGYEGLLNWYTSMAGSSNTSIRASKLGANDPRSTRVPDPTAEPTRPGRDDQHATTITSDQTMGEYPFDLDLLNADWNTAFFTPNFAELGIAESELFETPLLWPLE